MTEGPGLAGPIHRAGRRPGLEPGAGLGSPGPHQEMRSQAAVQWPLLQTALPTQRHPAK